MGAGGLNLIPAWSGAGPQQGHRTLKAHPCFIKCSAFCLEQKVLFKRHSLLASKTWVRSDSFSQQLNFKCPFLQED